MKKEFICLGEQPIANAFRTIDDLKEDEFKFRLAAGFDDVTGLVSLMEFVDKEKLFNDEYKYSTSTSPVMVEHFKKASELVKIWGQLQLAGRRILEIGSNDGAFLKNFDPLTAISVEPCGNFAEITEDLGYRTYNSFWNNDTAEQILNDYGSLDAVFAANCFCHIPEIQDAFDAVGSVLRPGGLFVFEDPSLLSMIKYGAFDQIYDEHAHIFSVYALQKMLRKAGMEIRKVESIPVHGNSNRIYATKGMYYGTQLDHVEDMIAEEKAFGIHDFFTFEQFAERVRAAKFNLNNALMRAFDERSGLIYGYGATSKATVVFNMLEYADEVIESVTDTTPAKIGKYVPGTDIPIVDRKDVDFEEGDTIFLGAWNYKQAILEKEQEALDNGVKFLTHIPYVNEIHRRLLH